MSACRACKGRGYRGEHYRVSDPCEACGGQGWVCDDPRGPDDPVTCEGPVVGWTPGLGHYCVAHSPSKTFDRSGRRVRP